MESESERERERELVLSSHLPFPVLLHRYPLRIIPLEKKLGRLPHPTSPPPSLSPSPDGREILLNVN